MIRSDFHVHTMYCDGASSPSEMVKTAIDRGMDAVGFSSHAYTSFDKRYSIKPEEIPKYKAEIAALRKTYADKIRIYCGIEQDLYSDLPAEGYDYVIGSVHYLKRNGVYISVDHSPERFEEAVKTHFGSDYLAFAEAYFEEAARVCEEIHPTFIGHFDLVSKFNEGGKYFDDSHPRYEKAWRAALSTLLSYNIPFEVNTGAISRGYRTSPYPSHAQLLEIKKAGGRVLLSGDAHAPNTLCFEFPKWEAYLREMGMELIKAEDLL